VIPRLTIVGASVRAAAASALRAGLVPWCADLFADTDLRAISPDAIRCPIAQYPHGFLDILARAPDCPWIYTGGLENYPGLIQRMSAIRPLWGNGPNTLRLCRSPAVVAHILRDAGIPGPELWNSDAAPPADRRWLRKPIGGSAGQGIAFVDATTQQASATHYVQEFIDGRSMSAVFVRPHGELQLIGVAEQLIGTEWLNAAPFHHAGNIGPIEISDHLRSQLLRIGNALSNECGLVGVFGIDFVLRDDYPWVVEVNPRYPASTEIYERALGTSLLALHRRAFDRTVSFGPIVNSVGPVVGKGILYTRRTIEFSGRNELSNFKIADVPNPGERIDIGWPVLTVLVHAQSYRDCVRQLQDAATAINRILFGGSTLC
jgi:predicted ATP-grasp superfamily ATP-dependent carboligase